MNQQFNFNSNRMPLQHHQHPNPFYNNFESLICRICLNPKPKSENVPLSLIIQPWRDITNQELKFDPELPDTTCTKCCQEINNYWAFRKSIIEKQNQLLMTLNNKRKMNIGPHRIFHSLYTVSVQPQDQHPAPHSPHNSFSNSSPPISSSPQRLNFPSNPPPMRMAPNHLQNIRPMHSPSQFPGRPNPVSQQNHPMFIRMQGPRIKRTYTKKKPESTPVMSAPGKSTNHLNMNGNSENMKTFVTANNNSGIETFEIIELPDENEPDINSLPEYIPLEPESILGDSSSMPRISSISSMQSLENFVGSELRTEDLLMDIFRSSPSPPPEIPNFIEDTMPPKAKKPKTKPKRRKIHTPKEGFREKCVVCGAGGSDRNYYPLPENPEHRRKWLELITIDDLQIPAKSVICDEHFVESNFQYYPDMKRNLKKKAIPTVLDSEKEISRMRNLALNAGIVKDCSIKLDIMTPKSEIKTE